LSGIERAEGKTKDAGQGAPQGAAAFLVTGTLALIFLFADVVLSIYYYRHTSGDDLRWLLALLDIGLTLSVLGLTGKRVSRMLVSMKLALTLLFVILIISVIGTILPNKDQVATSGWVNNPLYDFYNAIGLFDMYYSRWFLFLLFLLATNLTWCIYKRLRVTLKNAIHPRVDVRSSFIANQPFTDSFPGRSLDDFRRAISGRRYRIHQAPSGSVLAEKGRFAALSSIVFHLSFLFLGVGGIIGGMMGWTDQLYIPDGSTVDVPHTMMRVTNHRFSVDFIPVLDERGLVEGYRPVDYSSDLEVTQDGQTLARQTITVNGPMRVNPAGANPVLNFLGSTSINFHQSAYDTTETGQYATILEVNYMPGKLLVYAGFVLMMGGITLALYIPHRRIWARVDESGALLVGGRSNRMKVSFARDFNEVKAGLVQEPRQEAGTDA